MAVKTTSAARRMAGCPCPDGHKSSAGEKDVKGSGKEREGAVCWE